MKARKGFNWVGLIALAIIFGVLAFMVVRDFRKDFEEAKAKEEVKIKDFRENRHSNFLEY